MDAAERKAKVMPIMRMVNPVPKLILNFSFIAPKLYLNFQTLSRG